MSRANLIARTTTLKTRRTALTPIILGSRYPVLARAHSVTAQIKQPQTYVAPPTMRCALSVTLRHRLPPPPPPRPAPPPQQPASPSYHVLTCCPVPKRLTLACVLRSLTTPTRPRACTSQARSTRCAAASPCYTPLHDHCVCTRTPLSHLISPGSRRLITGLRSPRAQQGIVHGRPERQEQQRSHRHAAKPKRRSVWPGVCRGARLLPVLAPCGVEGRCHHDQRPRALRGVQAREPERQGQELLLEPQEGGPQPPHPSPTLVPSPPPSPSPSPPPLTTTPHHHPHRHRAVACATSANPAPPNPAPAPT